MTDSNKNTSKRRTKNPRVSAVKTLTRLRKYQTRTGKTPADLAQESGLVYASMWAWCVGVVRSLTKESEELLTMYLDDAERKEQLEAGAPEQQELDLPKVNRTVECNTQQVVMPSSESRLRFDLSMSNQRVAHLQEENKRLVAQMASMQSIMNDSDTGEVQRLRRTVAELQAVVIMYREGGGV